MLYEGLGDPKWSISIRYAELGTLNKRTRTLSGVNFAGKIFIDAEGIPEGYSASEISDNFIPAYLNVCQGTLDTKALTAQFNFEEV